MTDEEIVAALYIKYQTMNECHVSATELKHAGYRQPVTIMFSTCGPYRLRQVPNSGRVKILKVTPQMINKQQVKHDGASPLPISTNRPVIDLRKLKRK